jgi:hypothetical protein
MSQAGPSYLLNGLMISLNRRNRMTAQQIAGMINGVKEEADWALSLIAVSSHGNRFQALA